MFYNFVRYDFGCPQVCTWGGLRLFRTRRFFSTLDTIDIYAQFNQIFVWKEKKVMFKVSKYTLRT